MINLQFLSLFFSVSGGELFDRIVDDEYEMTEDEARDYMRQLLLGVQHMHKKNIVHLDLKVKKNH